LSKASLFTASRHFEFRDGSLGAFWRESRPPRSVIVRTSEKEPTFGSSGGSVPDHITHSE
jgi:hypothetical protein